MGWLFFVYYVDKSGKRRNERNGKFLRISLEIPAKFRLVPANGNGGYEKKERTSGQARSPFNFYNQSIQSTNILRIMITYKNLYLVQYCSV